MRISTDPADRAFDERRARRATVFLNGAPVERAITADDTLGFVVVSIPPRERRPGTTGRLVLSGHVRIEIAPDDAPARKARA